MCEVRGNDLVLNDGTTMPLLGLGCWQSPSKDVKNAVSTAIQSGYRHIDTAYAYLNEEAVGEGIREGLKKIGKDRKSLYVTTKLPMTAMRPEDVEPFMKLSLKKLGLDYVDMYLIHNPVGAKNLGPDNVFPLIDGIFQCDISTDLIAVWKAMEKMVEKGFTKSIGVSNYNIKQVTKTYYNAKIKPAVNQVEMHVELQQKPLQEFCKKHQIGLTAYAPLGSPVRPPASIDHPPKLLDHPVVRLVGEKHKKTNAQVLVRFWIQQGVVCIPKSVTPSRIKENGDVLSWSLDDVDMAALRFLDRGEEGRSFRFMSRPGMAEHPECPLIKVYPLPY